MPHRRELLPINSCPAEHQKSRRDISEVRRGKAQATEGRDDAGNDETLPEPSFSSIAASKITASAAKRARELASRERSAIMITEIATVDSVQVEGKRLPLEEESEGKSSGRLLNRREQPPPPSSSSIVLPHFCASVRRLFAFSSLPNTRRIRPNTACSPFSTREKKTKHGRNGWREEMKTTTPTREQKASRRRSTAAAAAGGSVRSNASAPLLG